MEVSCFIPRKKNTFTVAVETSQKVAHLQDKIKEKKLITFTNVEADTLNLYQVTIEEDLNKKLHMEELKRLYKEKEKESKRLNEGKVLQTYFDKSPPLGLEYYIIVDNLMALLTCPSTILTHPTTAMTQHCPLLPPITPFIRNFWNSI